MRRVLFAVNKHALLEGLSDQRVQAESSRAKQTLIFPLKTPEINTCRNSTDPNPDPFKCYSDLNTLCVGCRGRVLPLPRNVHVSLIGLQLAPRVCAPATHLWLLEWSKEVADGREEQRAKNNAHKWEWRILFQISQVKKMRWYSLDISFIHQSCAVNEMKQKKSCKTSNKAKRRHLVWNPSRRRTARLPPNPWLNLHIEFWAVKTNIYNSFIIFWWSLYPNKNKDVRKFCLISTKALFGVNTSYVH